MERGGCRRRGLCLRRLRVPACSTRRRWQRRGARWSVASRDRESPCATWGLTASRAPRRRCLGVLQVRGISLGIPLCSQRERPQPLDAASRPCGSRLQLPWADPVPAAGCPQQQPHGAVQSRGVSLHHVRGGRGAGSRSGDAGCRLCRAIATVGCGCEFLLAVAEPKKPLKMKILVCREAFFHRVLTRVFFPAPWFPHCVVCLLADATPVRAAGGTGALMPQEPRRVAGPQGGGVWVRGKAAENVKGAFLGLKRAAFDYGSSLRRRAQRSN